MSKYYRSAMGVLCLWPLSILLCFGQALGAESSVEPFAVAKRVVIVTGANGVAHELKAADLLRARILKRSAVTADLVSESTAQPEADVVFVVGTPEGNALVKKLMQHLGAALPGLPNSDKLHPEGFAVKSGTVEGKKYVVIAGADARGTIYGVGHTLRALNYLPDAVQAPPIDAAQKPALGMRGGVGSGPGSRAIEYGDLRPQTADELLQRAEDHMFIGSNTVGMSPAAAAPYGMQTYSGRNSNDMQQEPFAKEWGADGGSSTRYVCPSVPEARAALLASFDKMFREAPEYDFYATKSGDPGGCHCDKCEPWGATYIHLVHEIADILHKYHPNTKVIATNQDLSNEGNQAIVDYLNSGDSSWLYALRYGPGADEMQTYIRGPVNPRWFEYEGFGPLGNYLKFLHHELPRTTSVSLFTDVSHWMQSQYGVAHPDIALAAVYDRRSWNARPRNYHKVGREIFHYVIGDLSYSEGMHDDFNKWFWYRLMWDPYLDAETITREYCRYWFGPDAETEASQAIFLMEETLEKPVIDNPGIAKAVDLLHAAGQKIPANLLKIDWRWRVMLQKALMDRYIQLELQRGRDLKKEAGDLLASVADAQDPKPAFAKAFEVLSLPLVNDEMKALKDEATKLGEESNTIEGYREPAPVLVDRFDLTEVGWWKDTVEKALAVGDPAGFRNTVRKILHYDDPGEGGFYDDLGWPAESPHLTFGETLWAFRPYSGPAKMSHYNLAFSRDRKGRGVSFVYDELDPAAHYVVRVSAGNRVGGRTPQGFRMRQGIKADGTVISEGFDVPTGEVGFFEFDIPANLTLDGKLEVALTSPAERPMTALYEIWLMRKDKMPWTARP